MGTETNESRDVPTEQNWGAIRPRIEDLYIQQDKSLAEVLQILEKHDGFRASSSQLKRRLKSWGVFKNLTAQQMEEIAQTLMRTNEEALTKRSSDKEVAKVNGQSVSLSKVKRFQKRRQMPLIQKGPAPILPSAHNNSAPTACFERESYGLDYDWLGEEDELSIPINAGLEFRNLFEDFAPLDDSAEAPNTPNSATLSQKLSRNIPNQSMDLDDSTDQPSKRKRSQSPNSSEQEGRIFACPFYKRDPTRYSEKNAMETKYRSCAGAYLHDISRLKQHLYRVHRGPEHQCPRCYKAFATSHELDQHATQQPPCPMLPRNPRVDSDTDPSSETISQDRLRLIKIRQRGKRQDEQWYQIFRILFPNEPLPASPYPGEGEIDEKISIEHFVKFFKTFGSATMPSESQKRYLLPLLPDNTRRIVESAIAQATSPAGNGEAPTETRTQTHRSRQSVPDISQHVVYNNRHNSLPSYPEVASYTPMTIHHPDPPQPFISPVNPAIPVTRSDWNPHVMELEWNPYVVQANNVLMANQMDLASDNFMDHRR